ncbi:MAG: rRNA maturation RNase YbeY [Clostridia bacterium]|nr:rRNA maturation RNase YbeY [Clostridia bacterium]
MKINLMGVSKEYGNVIRQAVKKTLQVLSQPDFVEMSVKFVDKSEIQKLNREQRKIDKPTDVLSFPATNIKAGEKIGKSNLAESSFDGKNVYLGDCALCLEVAEKQAGEFGNTAAGEVKKLVVHSTLHLLGYDHIKDEDYAVMHAKEKEILGEADDV